MTAQRRSENLSRTPVAVTVVSAETLARAQITQANDLRQAAPGLSIRSGTGSEQLNFAMRGNTQDPFSNVRPGVLPYINEVQIGSPLGSGGLYDLQSVQVLKGPQGTLFGRSATGGALLFATQKPTDELGGYVSGLYGNYDQMKVEGALNTPLAGDQLMLRIAGFYSRRDGYQYNLFTQDDAGKQRKFGFRPSLTARFGSSITNELMVDYYQSDSQNAVGLIGGILPFTGTGAPFVPGQLLYSGTVTPTAAITGQCTLQAFAGLGPCPPVNPAVAAFYGAYFADPRHPATGLTAELAAQQARGPYVVNSDAENVARARNTVVTNTTSFDLGGDTAIKNIFGYVDSHTFNAFEADGTPYSISQSGSIGSGNGFTQVYHAVSEELQISGKALGGQLDYVVGGYFSHERNRGRQVSSFFDILFGGQSQVNSYIMSTRTFAGYGQGTFRFGDTGIAATAGLRYTNEEVRKQIQSDDSFRIGLGDPAPVGFDYDQSRTFRNLSWTVGLQYQASDALLLYVKNRRAFRSGGFNSTVAPLVGSAATGGDSYLPERVTDVEAGAKYNGHIGGMPIRLAGDVYYNWIKDSQRVAFTFVNGGVAALTVNVPRARTYGLEVEGQIRPTDILTLGGALNYTNARFTSQAVSVVGETQVFDQVPDTPRYSGMGFADISIPIDGDLMLLAHGDAFYQSSSSTSPRTANYSGTLIKSYVIANFRLGIEQQAQGWSLTANLKNAFKKVYHVGGLQGGEVYQINTLIPGEPRTITVEARLKF